MSNQVQYATVLEVSVADTAARSPYVTGYGRKIPTRYTVITAEAAGPRRVWAMCYANSASFYIICGGEELFIRDADLATGVCECGKRHGPSPSVR